MPARPPTARISVVITATLAAASLALAGCSGPTSTTHNEHAPTPTPYHLITGAYATTTAAHTARFSETIESTPAGGQPATHLLSTGSVDFARHATDIVTSQVAGTGGWEVITISAGTRTDSYVNAHDPAAAKPWMHSRTVDSINSPFIAVFKGDPAGALRLLKGLSRSITKVGSEPVHGRPATHYRALIDIAGLAAASGPAAQCAYQQEERAGNIPATWPFDVWLDGHGRLTQLQLRYGNTTASQPATITITLYDFGAPISITAPPAAATAEFPASSQPTETGCSGP